VHWVFTELDLAESGLRNAFLKFHYFGLAGYFFRRALFWFSVKSGDDVIVQLGIASEHHPEIACVWLNPFRKTHPSNRRIMAHEPSRELN
jgi:hypothetical protein